MRGFVGGMIVGTAIVAVVGAGMSLVSPLPQRPVVDGEGPRTGTGTQAPDSSGPVASLGTDADLVELAPVGPGRQEDGHETRSALDAADTEPADKPSVGPATGAMDGPGEPPQSPGVAVEADADAPVSSGGQAVPPQSPPEEDAPTAATDVPAQPAAPEIGENGTGFAARTPQEQTAPEVVASVDPAPDTQEPASVADGAAPESAPQASTDSAAAPPPTVTAPATTPTTTPVTEASGPSGAEDQPAAPAGSAPAPETGGPAPQIAALPQTGAEAPATASPTIGTPVVPLTERDKPAPEPESEPAAMVAPDTRPLDSFAAPFENPEGKPLMAIVLIDDDKSLGAEALKDFPYPLSFAVDPSAPDAAEKMARYRAAGQEVVAMLNMPKAATPQDAEVSLSVWLETLPETVALLEGTGSGIQGNRDLAEHVSDIAGSTGRGLIMQDNGLNTVQKLAARSGVPSAVVFRDFDGAGQNPTVMRRFLDQAAFRARQEGAVIMLGRVRPDTISALLLWGLQDRASRVALAPVSAVLTQAE